jgi:hypothetical protein
VDTWYGCSAQVEKQVQSLFVTFIFWFLDVSTSSLLFEKFFFTIFLPLGFIESICLGTTIMLVQFPDTSLGHSHNLPKKILLARLEPTAQS